jgi:hypothetical protein
MPYTLSSKGNKRLPNRSVPVPQHLLRDGLLVFMCCYVRQPLKVNKISTLLPADGGPRTRHNLDSMHHRKERFMSYSMTKLEIQVGIRLESGSYRILRPETLDFGSEVRAESRNF